MEDTKSSNKVRIVGQSVECLTDKSEYSQYAERLEGYARICFQSRGHKGDEFVRGILHNQHESVLEHFSLSFKIVTDRAMANALVRHRHTAYTQESTHYIDYAKRGEPIEFVRPPGFREGEDAKYVEAVLDVYRRMEATYGRDAARSFLPLGLRTELRMTTNLREWRHIIRLRGAFDHPQMLELVRLLYGWFKRELPLFVEDITVK